MKPLIVLHVLVCLSASHAFKTSQLQLLSRSVRVAPTLSSQAGVEASIISTTNVPESRYWTRKSEGQQQRIHYARHVPSEPVSGAPAVLLLNGFGVGEAQSLSSHTPFFIIYIAPLSGFFHWDRNVAPISASTGREVWTMDYLGQGSSWPVNCNDGNAPSEQGLRYTADGWIDQTIEFIEKLVGLCFSRFVRA